MYSFKNTPLRTSIQSIPAPPATSSSQRATAAAAAQNQPDTVPSAPFQDPSQSATSGSDSATKLAEAIDDFLGDLETKFKGISNEILTKRKFHQLPRNASLCSGLMRWWEQSMTWPNDATGLRQSFL